MIKSKVIDKVLLHRDFDFYENEDILLFWRYFISEKLVSDTIFTKSGFFYYFEGY